jgi:hypothetical protein
LGDPGLFLLSLGKFHLQINGDPQPLADLLYGPLRVLHGRYIPIP